MRIGIFLCWLLCLSHFSAFSQELERPPLQIGLGLAGFAYEGDLTTQEESFRRLYPGANISIQFDGNRLIQMQANVGFGRFVEQTDKSGTFVQGEIVPNSFVETSFFYTDLRFRIFPLKGKSISPYLGLGAGILFYNPKDEDGNFLAENIFTREDQEVYNSLLGHFPISGGVLVKLNSVLTLGGEYIYRVTPTDYLDNIGQLGNDPGNDALHAFQLSMYIALKPDVGPSPKPIEPPKEELPVLAIADKEGLKVPNHLSPIKEADIAAKSRLALMLAHDMDWLLYWEAEEDKPQDRNSVMPPSTRPKARIDSLPDAIAAANNERNLEDTPSSKDLAETSTKAIEKTPTAADEWKVPIYSRPSETFIFYEVKKGDEISQLASQFGLSEESLRSFNYLVEDSLTMGTLLRLPNKPEIRSQIVRKPAPDSAPMREPISKEVSEDSGLVDWAKVEAAAISAQKFVFIKMDENKNLRQIALDYHVQLPTLKELNHMVTDEVEAGTYLRIPDMSYRPSRP